MNRREMLWQKYVQLQLFHKLCLIWVKVMSPASVASITSAIIVCFYITIRHNDVPSFLIPVFFYVGTTCVGIIFWLGIQVIDVSKASEALIGRLTAIPVGTGNEYGISDPRELKKYIVRKGKATRAIKFRFGDFTDVTIDVPIGVWDEILNQVLFLLSF